MILKNYPEYEYMLQSWNNTKLVQLAIIILVHILNSKWPPSQNIKFKIKPYGKYIKNVLTTSQI